MKKHAVLCIVVVLAVLSLISTRTALAPIAKPSVPEFTLRYASYPFYVQPTYTIDTYTGKQVVESEGGYVRNDSIEIVIGNQPFALYKETSSNSTVYFNIKYKGHFGDQWQTYPAVASEGYWEISQSDYTVVSFPSVIMGRFPADGQMDFQVQALIGYETTITGISQIGPHDLETFYTFHGAEGSWSNTQTINLP